MVTVKIDEDALIKMLLDRLKCWTSDESVKNLYKDYYEELVYSGCFEGCKLDIEVIVDNDYVNYFKTISKEEFGEWNIESEEDNRIRAFNKEKNLYLIETY